MMEGDSESMVAIVQSLDRAGICVTLMSQRELQQCTNLQRTNIPEKICQRQAKQTCTPVRYKGSAGVQICDGRYTSSYKLAHCGVVPTSPTENVSEFPPQKHRLSHNQGNFEVGGGGSRESRMPPVRSRTFRGGLNWSDRGSVYHCRPSRCLDAFVHSLRKYPHCAPDRSVSSDLLEKIIKFTQSKNSAKPKSSRSQRTLKRDQITECKEVPKNHKLSKHIQTYTRAKMVREYGASSSYRVQMGYKKKKKDKLFGPKGYGGNRQSGFTFYDYLKVGSSRRSNKDERKREEKMKRGYKEVYQMCPKVRGRYLEHKKSCNAKSSMNEDQSCQASIPVFSRILATISGCGALSYSTVCPGPSPACCGCTKSSHCRPEDFDPVSDDTQECHCCPVANSTQAFECICKDNNGRKDDSEFVCSCGKVNEQYFSDRIDEILNKWLQQLPVPINDSEENKAKRYKMIEELGNALKSLPDDEDFVDNAIEEIKKTIDELPMWNPGTKAEQERFKHQLAETLAEKVADVSRKPNKFIDAIRHWIGQTKFTDAVDEKDLEEYLSDILKSIVEKRPSNDEEYRKNLKERLIPVLEGLPIVISGDKKTGLDSLANNLIEKIVALPKNIELPKDEVITKALEHGIKDWFDEVAEVAGDIPEATKKRMIKNLATKFNKLHSQGLDDKTLKQKMTSRIEKTLDELGIEPEKQTKLIDDLLRKMSDAFHYSNETPAFKEILDKLTIAEGITDFLSGIPPIDELSDNERQDLSNKLAEIIEKSKEKGNKEYTKLIKDFLKEHGVDVHQKDVVKAIENMADMILRVPPLKVLQDHVKDDIIKNINDIIDEAPMSANEKTNLKNKLKTLLDNNLDKLATSKDKDLIKMEILDRTADLVNDCIMPYKNKEELRNKLCEQIEKNVNDVIRLTKKRRNLADKVEKHIDNALEKIPIDAQQKRDLKQKILNTLKSALNEPLPKQVKDAMYLDVCDEIDKLPILKNQKDALKDKIISIMDDILDQPHVQGESKKLHKLLTKKINDIINDADIPEAKKRELRYALKNVIARNLIKPLTSTLSEAITDAVGKLDIPDDLKEKVINEMTYGVLHDIEASPMEKDETDHLKDDILNDIMQEMDQTLLPGPKRNRLKSRLADVLNRTFNDLDKPLTQNEINDLKDNLLYVMETSSLTELEKAILKAKIEKIKHMLDDTYLSDIQPDSGWFDDTERHYSGSIAQDEETQLKDRNRMYGAFDSTEDEVGSIYKNNIQTAKDLNDIFDKLPINESKKDLIQTMKKNLLEQLSKPMTSDEKQALLERLVMDMDNLPLTESQRNFLMSELTNLVDEKADIIPDKSEFNKDASKNDSAKERMYKYVDLLPLPKHQKKEVKKMLNLPTQHKDIIKQQKNALKKPGQKSLKEHIQAALGQEPLSDTSVTEKDYIFQSSQTDELSQTAKTKEGVEQVLLDRIDQVVDETQIPSSEKHHLKHKLARALSDDLSSILSDKIFTPTVTSTPKPKQKLEDDDKRPMYRISDDFTSQQPQFSRYSDRSMPSTSKWSTISDQDMSTSTRKNIDRGRPDKKSTLSTIYDEDVTESDAEKTNEAKKIKTYIDSLKRAINNWLDELTANISAEDKKDIIDGLVSDIIAREKYLQSHPEAKRPDKEEKKNYKYQLYKRLNRILDVDDLVPALLEADKLIDLVKRIDVPKLMSPSGTYDEIINKELDGASKKNRRKRRKERRISQIKKIIKQPISQAIEDVLDLSALPLEETKKDAIRQELGDILSRLADSQTDVTRNESAIIKKLIEAGYPKDKAPDLAERLIKRVVGEVKKGKDILHEMEKTKVKGKKAEMAQRIAKVLNRSSMTEAEKSSLLDLIDLLDSEDESSADDGQAKTMRKRKRGSVLREEAPDMRNLLDDFIFSLPIVIKSPEDKKLFEKVKKELQSALEQQGPDTDYDKLRETIKSLIKSFPLHPDALHDEAYLDEKADELIKIFQNALRKQLEKSGPEKVGVDKAKKGHEGLYDFIDESLAKLEFTDGTDNDVIKKIIAERAALLRNKIGEMNLDTQIFNDDFLYEDVVDDEIDNLLSDLQVTEESAKAVKEDLKKKILEAKQKLRGGFEAQMYKQQLKEAISTTLPEKCNASTEDKAIYEILKDELADAFINLHYSGGNEELRKKLKDKIKDEIHKFCFGYLKTCPSMPIDINKINNDLYTALNNVPIPKDESMRPEVRQARIRNEIADWMEKLPLKRQSPSEILNAHKMVYVLARKLNDIEEGEGDLEQKYEEMRKEIIKWLKKMPLKPSQEKYINNFADDLVDILKDTEESRRFDASKRYSMSTDGDAICPFYKSIHQYNRPEPCKPCDTYKQCIIPPCTLSAKDKCQLEKVKARAKSLPMCKASSICKAVNEGCQTDLELTITVPCPKNASPRKICSKPCLGISRPSNHSVCHKRRSTVPSGPTPCGPQLASSPCLQSNSREEVQPHVIVKEYYWNSPTTGSQTCQQDICPARPSTCTQCSRKRAVITQCPQKSSLLISEAPRTWRENRSSPYFVPLKQSTPEPRCFNTSHPNIPKRNGLNTDYPDTCSSKSSGKCVIELGSLSDLGPRRNTREDFDCSSQFEDERRPYKRCLFNEGVPDFDEETQGKCTRQFLRCKDGSGPRPCQSRRPNENLRRCQNCNRGPHCPYPSYFYFRQ